MVGKDSMDLQAMIEYVNLKLASLARFAKLISSIESTIGLKRWIGEVSSLLEELLRGGEFRFSEPKENLSTQSEPKRNTPDWPSFLELLLKWANIDSNLGQNRESKETNRHQFHN